MENIPNYILGYVNNILPEGVMRSLEVTNTIGGLLGLSAISIIGHLIGLYTQRAERKSHRRSLASLRADNYQKTQQINAYEELIATEAKNVSLLRGGHTK